MSVEISNEEALAALFRALGDPTRLRIFQMLRCCDQAVEIDDTGECRPAASLSVSEVCCRFGQSLSTVSFHLKELRLAGLIRTEKRGRWIYCSVRSEALEHIRQFLEPPLSACECAPVVSVPVTETEKEVPVGR